MQHIRISYMDMLLEKAQLKAITTDGMILSMYIKLSAQVVEIGSSESNLQL